jgi:hypothetical protein
MAITIKNEGLTKRDINKMAIVSRINPLPIFDI